MLYHKDTPCSGIFLFVICENKLSFSFFWILDYVQWCPGIIPTSKWYQGSNNSGLLHASMCSSLWRYHYSPSSEIHFRYIFLEEEREMVQWVVAPFVHDEGSVQSQHPSASPCTEQTQAIYPAQEPFLSNIGCGPPKYPESEKSFALWF